MEPKSSKTPPSERVKTPLTRKPGVVTRPWSRLTRDEINEMRNKPAAYIENASQTCIELTEEEKQTFELLLQVDKEYDLKSCIRVAGGWVRDKLLGLACSDIDISISNMSGEKFALHLNQYLQEKGTGIEAPHIAITKLNPEQSKHLETAVMRLNSMELNFVELRSEEYNTTSRIPTTKKGIPFIDAHRRDFTINALFYNIKTDVIEDFTARGISDLSKGLLTTPLNPKVTFLEDPLRGLRAFRFLATYKFKITKDVMRVVASAEFFEALKSKVSIPRISSEALKILTNRYVVQAVMGLEYTNLLPVIFFLPCDKGVAEYPQWTKDMKLICTHSAIALKDILKYMAKRYNNVAISNVERGALYHAALVRNSIYSENPKNVRDYMSRTYRDRLQWGMAACNLATSVLTLSYDLHLLFLDIVVESFDSRKKIDNYTENYIKRMATENKEDYIRFLVTLRNSKHLWPLVVLFTYIHTLEAGSYPKQFVKEIAILRAIKRLRLKEKFSMDLYFDGYEIQEHLNLSPGPQVGKAITSLLEWQLSNPDGTKDAALQYLTELYKNESQHV